MFTNQGEPEVPEEEKTETPEIPAEGTPDEENKEAAV